MKFLDFLAEYAKCWSGYFELCLSIVHIARNLLLVSSYFLLYPALISNVKYVFYGTIKPEAWGSFIITSSIYYGNNTNAKSFE